MYGPLRARASQLTAGLRSTCPQTDVKDHQVNKGDV